MLLERGRSRLSQQTGIPHSPLRPFVLLLPIVFTTRQDDQSLAYLTVFVKPNDKVATFGRRLRRVGYYGLNGLSINRRCRGHVASGGDNPEKEYPEDALKDADNGVALEEKPNANGEPSEADHAIDQANVNNGIAEDALGDGAAGALARQDDLIWRDRAGTRLGSKGMLYTLTHKTSDVPHVTSRSRPNRHTQS